MTVAAERSHLVDDYTARRVALHELSPLTARNTRCALRLLERIANAGGHELLEVDRADVLAWLAAQYHLAPATRRARFSAVRLFCRWLVEEGYAMSDATAGVAAPRQPRSVPRALEPSSVARLLEVCPDARARAIVWLMVGEGLRCSEVAGLEVGDWNRHAEVLHVRGKGGHERVLPVVASCARALDDYLDEHPAAAGALIRSYRVEWRALTPGAISKHVSELMALAGIKRTARDGRSAHALRHTAASDVLDACGDLRVVQEMLGHRNLKTTEIYLRRANLGQMRTAMEGRTYHLATV